MRLKDKRTIITGGSGFLGVHLRQALIDHGVTSFTCLNSKSYDLRHREEIYRMMLDHEPEVVIHMAAICGGIGANMKEPGRFFYENAVMNLNMMEVARLRGVKKYVAIGSICAFPKHCPVPFKEEDIWNGYPEETNAPYGIAKKLQLVQAQAYREQYGFNAIYLSPVNLYGPHDNFDLQTSHVIPAIIRKCVRAKRGLDDKVVLWGDGRCTREFLYAPDCAQAILMATEKYDGSEPINIGTGGEIDIYTLAITIAGVVGYEGEIEWDKSYPNGQPRRCLDVTKAEQYFDFVAPTALMDGLQETVDWYLSLVDSGMVALPL